jgi:uncharacterized protein (TIRG00374 family)
LASLAFISAFIFRALRWRLFLYPVRQVATIKVIQVFLVGVFLNFVLPLRIGELAKCFILKRTKKIAIAHCLPTITMDKVLDLLPAFVVIAMVPVLGKQMDLKLWSVLVFAVGGLVGLTLFVALLTWKRTVALSLLHRVTLLLPRVIQEKIEHFVTSFVDALLTSVSRPRIFVPAVLLTSVAVCLNALYNMFAFWTVGYSISFEQAVFGYLLFNLFYILPTPPGQVGSNEVVGLLIFTGLLSIPVGKVIAMIVLFHTWSGLLMCVMGMGSLSALGISLGHAVNIQHAQERHTTMSDHT